MSVAIDETKLRMLGSCHVRDLCAQRRADSRHHNVPEDPASFPGLEEMSPSSLRVLGAERRGGRQADDSIASLVSIRSYTPSVPGGCRQKQTTAISDPQHAPVESLSTGRLSDLSA